MVTHIEPADLAEADASAADYPTVAPQQCGVKPDAYEVRCTDGGYEWRRPYHGELEVIMNTGKDKYGKPFEYRELYAANRLITALLPEDVAGLVERLRQYEGRQWETTACYNGTRDEAASLIQSQAARIAELEAGLEAIAVFPNPPTVSQARARAMLNKDSSHD